MWHAPEATPAGQWCRTGAHWMLDPGIAAPVSATAVAVTVTGSPTAYSPALFGVRVSEGRLWLVVTGTARVSDEPWLSVTVTVAAQSALDPYLWLTTGPVAVWPSPKFQLNWMVSPGSGS